MDAKAENPPLTLDTVKLVLALVILVAGIVAYYYYADIGLIYRVLGVIATTLASIGIMLTTVVGRNFLGFLKESRVEVRKVVWPTRQETVQTTLVVVALVLIVGLLLWTLDAALFWVISHLTGQGK